MGSEERGIEFEVISYSVVHDKRLSSAQGWLLKGKNGQARIRISTERIANADATVDDLLKQAERDELNGWLFISDAELPSFASETGNS
jgi:hypothetical protein